MALSRGAGARSVTILVFVSRFGLAVVALPRGAGASGVAILVFVGRFGLTIVALSRSAGARSVAVPIFVGGDGIAVVVGAGRGGADGVAIFVLDGRGRLCRGSKAAKEEQKEGEDKVLHRLYILYIRLCVVLTAYEVETFAIDIHTQEVHQQAVERHGNAHLDDERRYAVAMRQHG